MELSATATTTTTKTTTTTPPDGCDPQCPICRINRSELTCDFTAITPCGHVICSICMPHFESSERSRTTQVDDLGVPRLPQCPICKAPCYFEQREYRQAEQRELNQAIQLSQEAASSPSATPSPSLSPSPRAAARAMHPLRLASHLSAPPPGVEVVDLLDDDDDDDDVDDPGDDDSLRHIGRPPRISGPADATVSSTRREGASSFTFLHSLSFIHFPSVTFLHSLSFSHFPSFTLPWQWMWQWNV